MPVVWIEQTTYRLQDGKRREIWDTKINGLVLQIQPTGTKSFYLRKRVKGGKPETVSLGRFPDITIEQARTKAQQLLSEFVMGNNPAEKKREEKSELTILGLFKKYMEYHGNNVARPDKLLDLYRLYLSRWDNKKISSLQYSEVDNWHKALPEEIKARTRQDVTGWRTANTALALLHAMYQKALKKRWFTGENPAYGIEKFDEVERERFLQADEMPRFFKAVMEEQNTTLRDYFLILLLTGARRSKVLSMQWDDINFERAEWLVPQERNQKNTANVPLVYDALEILKHRKSKSESEFVFPGAGKNGHLAEPRKGWERILARANLKDLRIHDLRRTFGSWQAKTGSSLVIIGSSLGHVSQQSTAIYSRLDLDPVRQSVERATNAMLEAGGLKEPAEVIPLKKSS